MAWGTKTQIANALNVTGGSVVYSDEVALNPGELAVVQVKGNSGGTTDNLAVGIYGTLDATAEEWDTVPVNQVELDCTDGGDNIFILNVDNLYRFKLGFITDGSTDTIVTNAYILHDGVSL